MLILGLSFRISFITGMTSARSGPRSKWLIWGSVCPSGISSYVKTRWFKSDAPMVRRRKLTAMLPSPVANSSFKITARRPASMRTRCWALPPVRANPKPSIVWNFCLSSTSMVGFPLARAERASPVFCRSNRADLSGLVSQTSASPPIGPPVENPVNARPAIRAQIALLEVIRARPFYYCVSTAAQVVNLPHIDGTLSIRTESIRTDGCGEGPEPAKAVKGIAGRTVLAADPAVVTDFVQQRVQILVTNLAGIGLVPFRTAGNLHATAVRSVAPQLGGEVALHHLHVVQIELHFEVGRVHGRADLVRFRLRVDEEAGHVATIDRLQEQHDMVLRQFSGGVFEVLDQGGAAGRRDGAGARDTGHGM